MYAICIHAYIYTYTKEPCIYVKGKYNICEMIKEYDIQFFFKWIASFVCEYIYSFIMYLFYS